MYTGVDELIILPRLPTEFPKEPKPLIPFGVKGFATLSSRIVPCSLLGRTNYSTATRRHNSLRYDVYYPSRSRAGLPRNALDNGTMSAHWGEAQA